MFLFIALIFGNSPLNCSTPLICGGECHELCSLPYKGYSNGTFTFEGNGCGSALCGQCVCMACPSRLDLIGNPIPRLYLSSSCTGLESNTLHVAGTSSLINTVVEGGGITLVGKCPIFHLKQGVVVSDVRFNCTNDAFAMTLDGTGVTVDGCSSSKLVSSIGPSITVDGLTIKNSYGDVIMGSVTGVADIVCQEENDMVVVVNKITSISSKITTNCSGVNLNTEIGVLGIDTLLQLLKKDALVDDNRVIFGVFNKYLLLIAIILGLHIMNSHQDIYVLYIDAKKKNE